MYRDAFAHAGQPSAGRYDDAVVELVTMGVGDLIWERHGHIALCVRFPDPSHAAQRLLDTPGGRQLLRGRSGEWGADQFKLLLDAHVDVCSNYGIGNFREPMSMAWGFFRGTKSFWAGPQTTRELEYTYIGHDRSVYAQPIRLEPGQKQRVIDKLLDDAREQNKYYAYDHFWDNCTTRVRDILDANTGHALSTMTGDAGGKTYRDLAREGFYGMRVPLLVTDIAMGRVTDREPSYYERMFLPEYLREAVAKKWSMPAVELYRRQGPPKPDDGPSGRFLLALVILAATSPVWLTRWLGRFPRVGLAIAIVPPVLLGLVLWTLAIISPLPYVRWNESCLIFFPFDLLLLVLPGARRRERYAQGRVVMLGLVLVLQVVGVLTQPLLAELLWPLIPAAVVGFWPARWTRRSAAA